ncbi:sigma-70 family RNA polymerase sigma factor [Eubacterium sp. 1001713B170207_170306_E7]|uniref:sigma-70 family RNA polymerase sigma factor n=1 Tax=Eubacterium sp. 1001713B170207_170306_E7 TaxID=2787097 RepID=UPI00189B2786|nr:sigma-70 family RNA polymerase sigma factor [Eubacterium sp. 1001713B170207_170306_E7]
MNHYREIDDLVKACKNGQEYPDGSPERESGSTAGQLLVMAFRPLILATLSRSGIHDDQFEDAFQDGVIAFMEGLKKFDPRRGASFNAFIQVHLRQYYRKWQHGQFNHSVKPDTTLDDQVPGRQGLTYAEVLPDKGVNIEADYIEQEEENAGQRVAKGLSRLKPSYRSVLEKHYYKGMTQTEIAQTEGISIQAVNQRHDRALKKLKKVL